MYFFEENLYDEHYGIVAQICSAALNGGEFMTKTKYEKELKALEEKEGKLFTIREMAEMMHVSVDVIHVYIHVDSIRTFKLRHYKTQQNVTLIPQNEVLKVMVKRTSVLPMLKSLIELTDNEATLSDLIKTLDTYRKG